MRSSMYDITIDTETAVILRDAIRVAIEQWSGGHPADQQRLFYLETEFNRMILESYLDA